MGLCRVDLEFAVVTAENQMEKEMANEIGTGIALVAERYLEPQDPRYSISCKHANVMGLLGGANSQ